MADTSMWLSFADDKGSRGIIVVDTGDFMEAVAMVNAAGISPHGQVSGAGFNPADLPPADRALMAGLPRMKLLTREEVEAYGIVTSTRRELEEREADSGT